MSDKTIEIVLEQYETIRRPYHIHRLTNKGVWVVNSQYVVKQIKNKNIANNICIILEALYSNGFLIVPNISVSKEQAFFHGSIGNFIIYKYIQGRAFKTEEVLKYGDYFGNIIGCGLSKLHTSFASIGKGRFENADTMLEYDEAIQFLFDKNLIIPIHIIDECELFKAIYKSLPRQLIHRDIHLKNIILDGKFDVHFIDFDSCEINIRIYDLAYFGVTLLESINNIDELKRWQDLFVYFFHGYYQDNKLNQVEVYSIWKMFFVLQICFIRYYFEKDNNRKDAEKRINKLVYVYNHRCDFLNLI